MKRTIPAAAVILAICAAVPALAADYPELRPAYVEGWEAGEDDIRFEFGTAYWYSWGGRDAGFTGTAPLGNIAVTSRDQTHIGELHGKIEDLSTQSYVAGRAGLGLHTTGTYAITPAGSGAIGNSSRIGYAGADFGWLPAGSMTEGYAFGGLVGYHYWKDAPTIGTGQYATSFAAGVPTSMGEARNELDIHALRLGVKGIASFDMFDIQGEVAGVPYAHVSGVLGGSSPGGYNFGGTVYNENAPTTFSGRGYGVMTEAMIGFHPTENLTLRLGGRAWYLESTLDAVFNGTSAGGAQPAQTMPSTYASLFRYGLRAELTGRF